MADNDQLLKKIGKLIEPIRAQLYEQGANIMRLVQGQTRLEKRFDNLGQAASRTNTALEALKAGQDDIREQLAKKADKADVLNVGVKIDKMRKRIEGLEEHTDLPHPDKN